MLMANYILNQSGYGTYNLLLASAAPAQLVIWIAQFMAANEIRPDGDFITSQAVLRVVALMQCVAEDDEEALDLLENVRDAGAFASDKIPIFIRDMIVL